jgi:hypothetical protein
MSKIYLNSHLLVAEAYIKKIHLKFMEASFEDIFENIRRDLKAIKEKISYYKQNVRINQNSNNSNNISIKASQNNSDNKRRD